MAPKKVKAEQLESKKSESAEEMTRRVNIGGRLTRSVVKSEVITLRSLEDTTEKLTKANEKKKKPVKRALKVEVEDPKGKESSESEEEDRPKKKSKKPVVKKSPAKKRAAVKKPPPAKKGSKKLEKEETVEEEDEEADNEEEKEKLSESGDGDAAREDKDKSESGDEFEKEPEPEKKWKKPAAKKGSNKAEETESEEDENAFDKDVDGNKAGEQKLEDKGLVEDGKVEKTIIIEHCKQCNSFKTRANNVKDGLEVGVPGIKVLLNPAKPRKGCFEIRDDGGQTFVSLLDLKRPFKKMKDLDMDQVVSDIISQI